VASGAGVSGDAAMRAGARRPGICPLGAGSRVFGGRVGSGAGVGIVCRAGPGSTDTLGLTMCGVTTIINSGRRLTLESRQNVQYNEVVVAHGRPFLYFLVLSSKMNKKAIEELESLMIGVALQKNSNLLNLSKTKQYQVVVRGVINSSAGAPTKHATAFRKMIGLHKKTGLR